MERSEPSLVPEWLRSTGGGNGGGSLSNHFASSQSDGPVLALPNRNRSSRCIGNSDLSHSSLLDRSSSLSSRRNSSSNGSTRHDKNSYARPYSSFTRSQRDRDKEKLTIADSWDLEFSDPLRSLINGRPEDTLRRSQSMVSRRQGEIPYRRITKDLRNGNHSNHDNVNRTHYVDSSVNGVQKVSFEREFPLLGSDERPKTPDIIRVSSPGLSRGIQSLSIGNSPLVGSEGWTSTLAEVPACSGSNSSASLQTPASDFGSNSLAARSTSSGLNMAEALVQAPARSHNIPQTSVQTQRDELAIAQSKKLIPMTPLLPKTLNSSDKLKPKTSVRSSEVGGAPKNGVQQLPQLQLGSQSARVRVDGPKSPSSGKLLLLKNGGPPVLKDIQSQTTNVTNTVAIGHSTASVPLKKISAFGLNPGLVVDKRPAQAQAQAQAQSRNDFFKLMRKKSVNNATCGTGDSGSAVTSEMVDKSEQQLKEVPSVQVTRVEIGSEVTCNGETCTSAERFSRSKENDNASTYPDEKEVAFLRSLGWEENSGDDDGLTEEEIKGFIHQVMKMTPTSKLCRVLQPKIFELGAAFSGATSTESSASASQTEA